MILVLFVLPKNEEEWVVFSEKGIVLNGEAYWFYPTFEETYTSNKETKRIVIPKTQRIDLDFFDQIFNLNKN